MMNYVLDREVVAEKDLLYGELMVGFGPSLSLIYEQFIAHALLSHFPN